MIYGPAIYNFLGNNLCMSVYFTKMDALATGSMRDGQGTMRRLEETLD